ncbi:MAG: (2Fe-2S) ferredoxin domain-containing protein [Alphaproteobacteria bacterium]|nr:(2Fe-2S) ferredoxin domain-containing protein [Alphaproteobacteria bacterium]
MNDNPNDPAPFYRRHVFFCVNEREDGHPRSCCLAKGSQELRDYMKAKAKEMGLKRIRINSSGCLDRCEQGPSLVIYPEGVWYTCNTREDVEEVLEVHVQGGGRVERLMMDQRTDGPAKT